AQSDRVIDGKRAEEEPSSTNKILESILSNMADAVIVADKEQKFLVFNPAARQIFGMGATATTAAEWPRQYGLYLPDKVTLYPPEELPLARSIRGEQIDDIEMCVLNATHTNGMSLRISRPPL